MIKKTKPTRISYERFKEIYHQVSRVTVEVVLVTPKGIALTLRRIPPYKGYWHTPGGSVLYKEKVKDAVKRVAEEELGVKIKIKRFLGFWEIPEWTQPGGFCHTVGLVFEVRQASGKIKTNSQSSKIKFFKKLPQKMIPEQKRFLEKNLHL